MEVGRVALIAFLLTSSLVVSGLTMPSTSGAPPPSAMGAITHPEVPHGSFLSGFPGRSTVPFVLSDRSAITIPGGHSRRAVAPFPWDSGVEYSGSAGLASNLTVAMAVPDDLPPSTDRYYVAVSVFDGAESYDQLGFANDNGSWQIYYSTAPACGTQPNPHWNAYPLPRNETYTFEISVEAGGVVLFGAYQGSAVALWEETVHTGATYLEVESTQTCGPTAVPGFTETEEVLAAGLGNPPYNFVFTNSTVNGHPEKSWFGLLGSSNTTVVEHNESNATIGNEPFTLGFSSSRDVQTIESGSSPQELETRVNLEMGGTGIEVGLSADTAAAAWKFSATPSSGNTSFLSVVSVDVPAALVPGMYVVEIEASDIAGFSNRIALVITVLPGLVFTVSSHPSSGEIDANETATFSPNSTGGRPAYTYSWPTLPVGCAQAPSGLATCRFVSPGTYRLLAAVVDTLNYGLAREITLTVVPDPVLSSDSGTVTLTVSNLLSLEVSQTGGISPFAVIWQGLPRGCASVNSTALNCTPETTGHFAVIVTLVDGTGFRSSLTISVTVQNPTGTIVLSLGTVGLLLIAGGMVVLIATCTMLLARRHWPGRTG
ncbi:MAG: hypothetical protein L3K02_02680 [Thermoplasmata archaeon]|nr:hypothetical protein [Thermoplasmata archaeon]